MSAADRAAPTDVPPPIDLNADVGEGYDDAELLPLLTSASIACGGHAGDDSTMRETLRRAHEAGLAIGAHPGDPDRAGFGRSALKIGLPGIEEAIVRQVSHLASHAAALALRIDYVKPHGAIYNRAATDATFAAAVARGTRRALPGIPIVLLAGSVAIAAAVDEGLLAIPEAFVDRGYRADGLLVARGTPGGVVEDPIEAARRALSIVLRGEVETIDGSPFSLGARTLCLHGDGPNAIAIARQVRARLLEARIPLRRFTA